MSSVEAPLPNAGRAGRIEYLDGWRGGAILALLVGHFIGLFGVTSPLMNAGRLGVELFFVLSGLLMANLLFVKRVTIADFYARRVSRIFPGLYFFLLCVLLWAFLRGERVAFGPALAVVLLYYNYLGAVWHQALPPEYAQVWSLCIEEHAYVLLSAIALITRRTSLKPHTVIFAAVLVSWALAAYYVLGLGWGYYRAFWRTEARLSGVFVSAGLVCWMHHTGRRLLHGPAWFGALGMGLALQTTHVPDLLKYTVGSAFLALAVTHLGVAPEIIKRVMSLKLLTWFGVLSYSIYLWQQPFKELLATQPRWLCVIGALAFGAASFYLVENPARRYLNRRWTPAHEAGVVVTRTG